MIYCIWSRNKLYKKTFLIELPLKKNKKYISLKEYDQHKKSNDFYEYNCLIASKQKD